MTSGHQNTYDAVFSQPIAQDLNWRDVRAMLVEMSDMVVERNDMFEGTRRGRKLVLRISACQVLNDTQELIEIRQFLE